MEQRARIGPVGPGGDQQSGWPPVEPFDGADVAGGREPTRLEVCSGDVVNGGAHSTDERPFRLTAPAGGRIAVLSGTTTSADNSLIAGSSTTGPVSAPDATGRAGPRPCPARPAAGRAGSTRSRRRTPRRPAGCGSSSAPAGHHAEGNRAVGGGSGRRPGVTDPYELGRAGRSGRVPRRYRADVGSSAVLGDVPSDRPELPGNGLNRYRAPRPPPSASHGISAAPRLRSSCRSRPSPRNCGSCLPCSPATRWCGTVA